ncbi:NAD(P)-dependent oxidoreductase [Simiduia curdlanivorans]|uniref:NAD(P)-dependent oxidoreductase n=1 Tax=Simiduia curdlanivorans TaxID=1492769 RepID=A0ABV8V8R9_9GAMM|nr:NAD(P)-dependent oxidoreductase [Simiduia curdlanivorans]MDN3639599.1 NAD(P)-dependent oxidoreductase [Simiduia curdlanivorans]
MNLAFVGLGVMGYPMAGHLVKAGHQVCVYNRTASKAQSWADAFGGRFELTPKLAAENADIVFVCVGNDDDLRSVVLGDEGLLAGMRPGTYLVDHTTASAQVARELSALAALQQVAFLDAPVSGGQAGAENGQLTVMVGGDDLAFGHVEPVIQVFAKSVKLLGPSGSGQLCKMVNQICIAGLVQGLAEGLHFAQSAGLDAAAVVEVISKGAAQSWQMDNRYKTMLKGEYNHGFAVDWMRKDLAIVLDEAKNNGARLPVTALVDQFYGEVQDMGGQRWDTSSLLARLEQHKRR